MKILLLVFTCFMILINKTFAQPFPTILDTDIGSDYDDQLALTFILANPVIFDLKLIICSTHNTTARAQIVAKTLALFNRFDVPIGIGVAGGPRHMYEYEWAKNYSLQQFQQDGGIIYENGEEALLKEMQKANPNNIYSIIEISPETSLGHVAERLDPEILRYIRVFAMGGSVYRGYANASEASKEYNIYVDIAAAQAVFNASWGYFGLAPLDTTIFAQFNGPEWKNFLTYRNQSKHVQLVLDSYTVWYNNGGKTYSALQPFSPDIGTSTMYDVLAVFLAASYPNVYSMISNEIPLIVTDDGYTRVNTTIGKPVNVSVDFMTSDPYTSVKLISVVILDSIISSK